MSSVFLAEGVQKRVKNTSAAAALCFEIAASVAGLKKHVYSYTTASEEISEKGCELNLRIGKSTHTPPTWDTQKKDVGRNSGRILDVLYRYLQTTKYSMFWSLNWNSLTQKAPNASLCIIKKSQICWTLYNVNQKSLVEVSQRSNRILV